MFNKYWIIYIVSIYAYVTRYINYNIYSNSKTIVVCDVLITNLINNKKNNK